MGQEYGKCSSCVDLDGKATTIHLDPRDSVDGSIKLASDLCTGHAFSEVKVVDKNNERVTYVSADGTKRELVRFKVSLAKPAGETFGLAHMPMEDGSQSLLVVELRSDGPIARWNMEQRALGLEDFEMRRGDRIVRVGKEQGLDAMRENLRKNDVEFVVERWPATLAVVLKKASPVDKYGMQTDLIVRDDDSKVLRVGRISGGLLGEWNASAAVAKRFSDIVAQHSEIASVNGCKDDPARMQQMLVTESEVQVVFRRPDPDLYNQ
jgi:hypothetical protein